MIILKNQAEAQLIKFIQTRDGVPNELYLTNETTNVVTIQSIDCVNESFYNKFSAILELEEGHFYTLTIKENQKKKEIDNLEFRAILDGGIFVSESCLYLFLNQFEYNVVPLHNDKIFVTNQEVGKYSINNNEYVQHADNIIFYE